MEVYRAIARVSAQLAQEGIAKTRKNSGQGFNFRGIDEILNTLAPILAMNELVIIPRVTNLEKTEKQSRNGGALFSVSLRMEFDLISAKDGSKHTAVVEGEAMDSGDKATNKAMSIAYKYMAILTFCIPTEGEHDPDEYSHEVSQQEKAKDYSPKVPQSEKNTERMITEAQLKRFVAIAGRNGWTEQQQRQLLAPMGITSRKCIPMSVYDQLIGILEEGPSDPYAD